jgi:hypothetical protein
MSMLCIKRTLRTENYCTLTYFLTTFVMSEVYAWILGTVSLISIDFEKEIHSS